MMQTRHRPTAFGFTERPEGIHVRGVGRLVSIESSELPLHAKAERSSLLVALARFRESVYRRLVDEVPGIEGNPVVQRLRSSA